MTSKFAPKRTLAALILLATLTLCSVASGDMIFIGMNNGQVIGRNELDLVVVHPLGSIDFGTNQPVSKLLAAQGDLVIGLGAALGPNVHVRHANALLNNVTDMATGFAISAFGYRSFDDCILAGDTGVISGGNGTFVRTRANLAVRPATYVGNYGLTDGGNWGMGITAYESFSDNGDFVVGTAGSGLVTVRQANSIWDYPTYMVPGHGYVYFGDPIVGIGIIDDTKYVVGTKVGVLSVRPRNDAQASIGAAANFALEMTAFLMLPGGKVAAGFANGEVDIRDTADLGAIIPGGSANFGGRVTALALTSSGNLVIATEVTSEAGATHVIYVHKSSDLLQPAEGLASTTLYTDAQINALATLNVPPPPPPTIDSARKNAEGTQFRLENVVVTAKFGDTFGPLCFGVQSADVTDRSAGMRVLSWQELNVGDNVTVDGKTTTLDGERVMDATGLQGSVAINTSGNPVPAPLGTNNLASGGGAYASQGAVVNAAPSTMATGTNSIGLLTRIWGRVTARNSTGDYDGYFYVDDGSGIKDGSGNTGIKCRPSGVIFAAPDALPALDSYVTVTGIMGVQQISGVNARYFWTQSWN